MSRSIQQSIFVAMCLFGVTAATAQDLTFSTPNGESSSLARFHGKVLVVEFIAPQACPRCEQLTVALNSLHNQYWSRGLEVLTLVVGLANGEQVKAIAAFGGQHHISLPLGFTSPDAALGLLGVTQKPTTHYSAGFDS